jgi:rhodanese-related sulfurtransferase
VLVCFTGHRSRWALSAVDAAVEGPVIDLRGGMLQWWGRKLPVVVERAP